MKYAIILSGILVILFGLVACHKNNNPVPAKKDTTVTSTVAADSATGIFILTGTNDSIGEVNSLFFYNPDGTLRWKRDANSWQEFGTPGYANGTVYLSTLSVQWDGVPRQSSYAAWEELYALDASDGSVKWSYVDSNYAYATPAADSGEIYLPQQGFIQGFDAHTGLPNWSAVVANGLTWTPLIDGDTLFTATAPLYTGYYNITAVDTKTGQTFWTTPIGYNPPAGILMTGGNLVFSTGSGALMAVDRGSGAIVWSVQDQQYGSMHVAGGNSLFTFNTYSPVSLYAFSLATGGQFWQANLPFTPSQIGGVWMYGKNVCYYIYDYPNDHLQTANPQTGDTVSRVSANGRYEDPLLVGHRIYARKIWNNTTLLATPQLAILDAGSLAVKDSAVITGVQQIISMHVIGSSGAIY